MNPGNIILNEGSHLQKTTYCMIWYYLYEISGIYTSRETENILVIAKSWGRGVREWLLMSIGFLSGLMKMT